MKPNLYRQLRFVVILVVGIGIVTTLVALFFAYRSEVLQREFLDSLAKDEYQELLEHLEAHPDAPLPKASQLEIWMDGHPKSDDVPESLRSLAPGTYHDVPLRGDTYHVLKTETRGFPTYVAIEISSFSSRERWLQGALISIALLDVPLALLMGIWLVRRISLPHEKLAQRVQALDPSSGTTHIGKDFVGVEVEQIAEAIDNYQDRLKGFVDRERIFTSAASHELRTPLTTMLTSAEVLHHNRRLPEELKPYTQRLIRTASQMGETLDGLMWLAREIERPELQDINIEGTVREQADYFPNKRIRIEVPDRPLEKVKLPKALFCIVLTNLLRNACQFSTPDSEVLVRIEPRKVTIRNAGSGIPDDKLQQIFKRNFKSSESPGRGLGLYIAANICDRLEWDLNILSKEKSTLVSVEV